MKSEIPLQPRHLACFLLLMGMVAACEDGSHPLAEDPSQEVYMTGAPAHSPVKKPLAVMSRNLYHGGDIGPVLQVGFQDLELLASTAADVWSEVLNNDFPERAAALVDEIQDAMPDIVGIQELARFEVFALDPSSGTFGSVSDIDFKTIMEDELQNRGLPYSFLAVQGNTVVKVPVAGFHLGGSFVPSQLVQLEIRDAVLVRDGLTVTSHSMGNYRWTVPLGIDPFGNPIEMKRGWIRVDAEVDGIPHHFVTTHMEIQAFREIQVKQAEELLKEIAADLDGVTILMGDFNSDASVHEGAPSWTPTYLDVIDAGFTDLWALQNPGRSSPGLTCCNASDLRNPTPSYDERIDFIFLKAEGLKGAKGRLPGAATVELVGADPNLKTEPSGMWPSDHAGLVAKLWWAPGQWGKSD